MTLLRRQMFLAMLPVIACCTLSLAKSLPHSQTELLRDLPRDLSALSWNSNSQAIEKSFGKPALVSTQGSKTFLSYSFAGGHYDTTFELEKGHLRAVSFLFPKQKWVAADMQDLITAAEVKAGLLLSESHLESHPERQRRHPASDHFVAVSVKNGVGVVISKDKTFSVQGLRFWKPGEPAP
jgi:hypothetical protein